MFTRGTSLWALKVICTSITTGGENDLILQRPHTYINSHICMDMHASRGMAACQKPNTQIFMHRPKHLKASFFFFFKESSRGLGSSAFVQKMEGKAQRLPLHAPSHPPTEHRLQSISSRTIDWSVWTRDLRPELILAGRMWAACVSAHLVSTFKQVHYQHRG